MKSIPVNSRRRKRSYRQAARAERTEANTQDIVEAVISLVHSARRLSEITLEDIARESGLTVRTILRRFGSRDGVLQAGFSQLTQDISRDRPPTPAGDIDAALASLLQHYEQDGDLNIKVLEQERELPLLHAMLEFGRAQHRAWLVEVFAPHLTQLTVAAREQRITELYAATDVYLWKLFRRDLGLAKPQTAKAFRHLVLGLVRLTHPNS